MRIGGEEENTLSKKVDAQIQPRQLTPLKNDNYGMIAKYRTIYLMLEALRSISYPVPKWAGKTGIE